MTPENMVVEARWKCWKVHCRFSRMHMHCKCDTIVCEQYLHCLRMPLAQDFLFSVFHVSPYILLILSYLTINRDIL